MSVELSIQAPLERAFADVANAIREGIKRFSNCSDIEVTSLSEDEMIVRYGDAIVQVTMSYFDFEPVEAGLWCTLDGGFFRDKSTYGLIVVIAEILAKTLGGKIVDESLWLGRGRYVPCLELECMIKRWVGDCVSEQALGNLAIELGMGANNET